MGQDRDAQDLNRTQDIAAFLGLDQMRNEIVAWIAAAFNDGLLQIGAQFGDALAYAFYIGRGETGAIGRVQQIGRPDFEVLALAAIDAEQFGRDADRHIGGEVGDEIELATTRHDFIQQTIDDGLDARLQRTRDRGQEGLTREFAQRRVRGRVHGDQ